MNSGICGLTTQFERAGIHVHVETTVASCYVAPAAPHPGHSIAFFSLAGLKLLGHFVAHCA